MAISFPNTVPNADWKLAGGISLWGPRPLAVLRLWAIRADYEAFPSTGFGADSFGQLIVCHIFSSSFFMYIKNNYLLF